MHSLEGWRQTIANFFYNLEWALTAPVLLLLGIVLVRIVFRRRWVAVLLLPTLFGILGGATSPENPVVGSAYEFLLCLLMIAVLVRFGLLALVVAWTFASWILFLVTTDPSAWYFGRSAATILTLAAIACYGFYTSLGGQRLFRDRVLDD